MKTFLTRRKDGKPNTLNPSEAKYPHNTIETRIDLKVHLWLASFENKCTRTSFEWETSIVSKLKLKVLLCINTLKHLNI